MLCGLVRSWGHDVTYEGAVADDYDDLVERLDVLAADHDVLLTTGGTSVGRKDYTIRALESLGTVEFHGVALRPGKPVALVRLPDHDATVFAIPGKPLGAHTAACLVARPFFVGATELPATTATMAVDVEVGSGEVEYCLPVTLDDAGGADEASDAGSREAMPLGHRESTAPVYGKTFDPSVVSSTTRVTRADGFVRTNDGIEAGTTVPVVPYPVVE
jgi:molybdopterin molybdotransferase